MRLSLMTSEQLEAKRSAMAEKIAQQYNPTELRRVWPDKAMEHLLQAEAFILEGIDSTLAGAESVGKDGLPAPAATTSVELIIALAQVQGLLIQLEKYLKEVDPAYASSVK